MPLSQSGQPPAAGRLEAEGHKCKQGTLWWRHLEGKKGLPFIARMPKDSFSQAIGRSPWGWSPEMKFTVGEVGCGLLELRGRKGRVIVRGFWTHGGMCSETVKEDECRGGTEQTQGWWIRLKYLPWSMKGKGTRRSSWLKWPEPWGDRQIAVIQWERQQRRRQ